MSAILKEKADFATQSGHWYDANTGEARYTIIGANGKERPTTVRDARKLGNLVPSVTTILKLAAAPGLEAWKIGNAIMSALTLPRKEGETDESYIYRITRDSEERARNARQTGTDIHGAIECFYRGRLQDTDPYFDNAYVAHLAVMEWAGRDEWDTERSFSHKELGYGGKLDLSRNGYVLDFKTTDKELDGLKLWPEHRRQLAAYRMGLGMPDAKCAICYVSTGDPKARLIELEPGELAQGWDEFSALLALWKAVNRL